MTIKYFKKHWSNQGAPRLASSVLGAGDNRTLIKISDADAEEFKKRGLIP